MCAVLPSRLYEYYDAIDDFCIRLRARHLDAWADQLTGAKAGGSMSGEILSNTVGHGSESFLSGPGPFPLAVDASADRELAPGQTFSHTSAEASARAK